MQATADSDADRPAARFVRLAATLGAVTLVVSTLTLLGWRYRVGWMMSVRPSWPLMSAGIAATGALAGLSLLLRAGQSWPLRLASRLAAMTMLALALLISIDYFAGWNLSFLDVEDPLRATHGRAPLEGAIGFVLLSLSLLTADRQLRSPLRVSEWLALAVLALAVFVLAGFGWAPGVLAPGGGPRRMIGMSLPAAISLLLVSTGILCSQPRTPMMAVITSPHVGGRMARRFLWVLIAVPVLGLVLVALQDAGLLSRSLGPPLVAVVFVAGMLPLIVATGSSLNRFELERRQREADLEQVQAATTRIDETVAKMPDADLRTVLERIVAEARALTGAEYGAIGFAEAPGRPFEPWVQLGVNDEEARAMARGPRRVGVLAVPPELRSLRVADVKQDPRFQGFPEHHPEITSFLGAQVRHGERAIGTLYLGNQRPRGEFTDEDQLKIELYASHAGAAIEVAKLYQAETQQRAWLQTVIDHLPEGVIIADRAGEVTRRNRLAREIERFTDLDGNALPLSPASGLPVEDGRDALERAVRGAITDDLELIAHRRGSEPSPMWLHATPVRGSNGEIEGAVALLKDLSLVKQIEKLREEWNSVIAHDLRQPVAVVNLSAQVLLETASENLGPEERRAIERIAKSSRKLSRMIEDLLDVSRLEARRLTIDRGPVELLPMLSDLVAETRQAAPDRPVHVLARGEPDQLRAWGDGARLEQVLANLVSNALKYGRDGTPIIVEVDRRDSELRIAVTNEGPGIERDELPRLFTRFSRTRDARRSSAKGLGLGLYIAKGLVEAHGGRLWAESTPNVTTTFTFTVPAAPTFGTSPELSANH